jgi:hypothetical protein
MKVLIIVVIIFLLVVAAALVWFLCKVAKTLLNWIKAGCPFPPVGTGH